MSSSALKNRPNLEYNLVIGNILYTFTSYDVITEYKWFFLIGTVALEPVLFKV